MQFEGACSLDGCGIWGASWPEFFTGDGMRAQIVAALVAGALVTSCGTYVPSIQEFPGDAVDGQLLVKSIVHNINCEITEAVHDIIERDKKLAVANHGKRTAAWFDDWGIQTTLSLTVDEKGAVNPTVNWLPPSPAGAIFNLAAGGTLSSEGVRIDKLNSYNTVKQFLANQCSQRPDGLWMLSSDLKLREWIIYVISAAASDEISIPADANGPWKANVISHEVKFIVSSSGSVTPGWKLTRVSVNQTGSLLAASRDRTHDLTITLGPADKSQTVQILRDGRTVRVVATQPSRQAADAHLASQIGSSVADGVRSALTPSGNVVAPFAIVP